ncbi:MAG: exodeoxyribonuclease III [Alphaproteobacteria bacterium]
MSLRIATWNICGVRRRPEPLARLVREAKPDVLCLQETKAANDVFPHAAIAALGFEHTFIHGMKGYNGLAILSRWPIKNAASRDCVGRADCRYAHATIEGIEIHNCYVPAGGDVPDPKTNDKFAHKLAFLDEMAEWWSGRRRRNTKAILVGDLNVAPLENDVWSHKQLLKVVSHTSAEVDRLRRWQQAHDWIDAVRHFVPPEKKLFSWWSFRNRDWAASDRGRRLDHIWATPALAGALKSAKVIREARGWPDASDHVPVVIDLKL